MCGKKVVCGSFVVSRVRLCPTISYSEALICFRQAERNACDTDSLETQRSTVRCSYVPDSREESRPASEESSDEQQTGKDSQ